MSRVKWTCTRCGTAQLGPRRPRKTATVRFCLPCSTQSPTLVERRALVVEAERTRAKTRRVARKVATRERAKLRAEDRVTVHGIDLAMTLRFFWARPSIKEARALPEHEAPPSFPELVVRRRKAKHTTGRAWSGVQPRIVITCGGDALEILVVLLHEVVHAALPDGDSHSPRFWSFFAQAAGEVWEGVKVDYGAARTVSARHLAVEAAVRRGPGVGHVV